MLNQIREPSTPRIGAFFCVCVCVFQGRGVQISCSLRILLQFAISFASVVFVVFQYNIIYLE